MNPWGHQHNVKVTKTNLIYRKVDALSSLMKPKGNITAHNATSQTCVKKVYILTTSHSLGWLYSKTQKIPSIGEDVEKLKPPYVADENVKWCSCHGKHFGGSSKPNTVTIWPSNSILGYIPKRMENK